MRPSTCSSPISIGILSICNTLAFCSNRSVFLCKSWNGRHEWQLLLSMQHAWRPLRSLAFRFAAASIRTSASNRALHLRAPQRLYHGLRRVRFPGGQEGDAEGAVDWSKGRTEPWKLWNPVITSYDYFAPISEAGDYGQPGMGPPPDAPPANKFLVRGHPTRSAPRGVPVIQPPWYSCYLMCTGGASGAFFFSVAVGVLGICTIRIGT